MLSGERSHCFSHGGFFLSVVTYFAGCLHHGHVSHLRSDLRHPHLNQTMDQLYNRTLEREKVIRKLGYSLRTIWECEFDEKVKSDYSYRMLTTNTPVGPRLDPRDALYGGRINATVLHYKCKDGEKILHDDVVSYSDDSKEKNNVFS